VPSTPLVRAGFTGIAAAGCAALSRRYHRRAGVDSGTQLSHEIAGSTARLLDGAEFRTVVDGARPNDPTFWWMRVITFKDGECVRRDVKREHGRLLRCRPIRGRYRCAGAEVRLRWEGMPGDHRAQLRSPTELVLGGRSYRSGTRQEGQNG
jgi:hypothetical protein